MVRAHKAVYAHSVHTAKAAAAFQKFTARVSVIGIAVRAHGVGNNKAAVRQAFLQPAAELCNARIGGQSLKQETVYAVFYKAFCLGDIVFTRAESCAQGGRAHICKDISTVFSGSSLGNGAGCINYAEGIAIHALGHIRRQGKGIGLYGLAAGFKIGAVYSLYPLRLINIGRFHPLTFAAGQG